MSHSYVKSDDDRKKDPDFRPNGNMKSKRRVEKDPDFKPNYHYHQMNDRRVVLKIKRGRRRGAAKESWEHAGNCNPTPLSDISAKWRCFVEQSSKDRKTQEQQQLETSSTHGEDRADSASSRLARPVTCSERAQARQSQSILVKSNAMEVVELRKSPDKSASSDKSMTPRLENADTSGKSSLDKSLKPRLKIADTSGKSGKSSDESASSDKSLNIKVVVKDTSRKSAENLFSSKSFQNPREEMGDTSGKSHKLASSKNFPNTCVDPADDSGKTRDNMTSSKYFPNPKGKSGKFSQNFPNLSGESGKFQRNFPNPRIDVEDIDARIQRDKSMFEDIKGRIEGLKSELWKEKDVQKSEVTKKRHRKRRFWNLHGPDTDEESHKVRRPQHFAGLVEDEKANNEKQHQQQKQQQQQQQQQQQRPELQHPQQPQVEEEEEDMQPASSGKYEMLHRFLRAAKEKESELAKTKSELTAARLSLSQLERANAGLRRQLRRREAEHGRFSEQMAAKMKKYKARLKAKEAEMAELRTELEAAKEEGRRAEELRMVVAEVIGSMGGDD